MQKETKELFRPWLDVNISERKRKNIAKEIPKEKNDLQRQTETVKSYRGKDNFKEKMEKIEVDLETINVHTIHFETRKRSYCTMLIELPLDSLEGQEVSMEDFAKLAKNLIKSLKPSSGFTYRYLSILDQDIFNYETRENDTHIMALVCVNFNGD